MFGLFEAKLLIDRDEFDWLLACTKWFVEEFEGMERLQKTKLILPTSEFFSVNDEAGHSRAQLIFDQVKSHADMAEWPCILKAGEERRESKVADGLALKHEHETAPLGTYQAGSEKAVITYDPTLLKEPESLIATFAHELAHYLMHSSNILPPRGHELEEHATDFVSAILGFGVFAANSAKSFGQFQNFGEMGWETRRQGYLSENALVTALAIFVHLTGESEQEVATYLKGYLRKPFKRACQFLTRLDGPLTEQIAAIDLEEWVCEKRMLDFPGAQPGKFTTQVTFSERPEK